MTSLLRSKVPYLPREERIDRLVYTQIHQVTILLMVLWRMVLWPGLGYSAPLKSPSYFGTKGEQLNPNGMVGTGSSGSRGQVQLGKLPLRARI